MEASHAFVPHTSELEMTLAAPTFPALCEEAARGLSDAIAAGTRPAATTRWERARIEGIDRAALLVTWLDELLYLVERTGLLPAETQVEQATDGALDARVGLAAGPLIVHVKAATWSGLDVVEDERGVHATVVLDV